MGRTAKKAPVAAAKKEEESPNQTITQSRTRRTPKPNPKYNDAEVATPKLESEDDPVVNDGEVKTGELKIVKPFKKAGETPASAKVPLARGRAAAAKKQKLDLDDEDDEATDEAEKPDEDEKAAPASRATRSGKGGADSKDSLKVGEDSVAIVDVSSIMSKTPAKPDSPKILRGSGRKRGVAEDSPKEDPAKKKKEEEKPSLITARKSYMPSHGPGKKAELKEDKPESKKDEEDDKKPVKEELKTPLIRTRRNAVTESPEPALKKPKVDEIELKPELKKLTAVRRSEITKVTPVRSPVVLTRPSPTLPTKIINNNTTISPGQKPVPRILNSMITPKGKQSPNVKLAGDGSDKKVFSIDLTDDSIKEKRMLAASPVKTIARSPVAVKENIANNKPQPSAVLKNRLESELQRMKASANVSIRRQNLSPAVRQTLPIQHHNTNLATRRITKFESWYVIDVKNLDPSPFRHAHTHSLIKIGNAIKDIQLPSTKWDYKVTLQRRLPRKENNSVVEVYTGEVTDKAIEADKANYEPSSILFKRSHRESNKVSIDRSLMLKQNMYTITMNGKQCKLIGAPDDIKTADDLEILLNIIDSSSLQHSCVELVTNHDIITIS